MRSTMFVALATVIALVRPAAAVPVLLTYCGAHFTDAFLAYDLDCSGEPGVAVTILADGTLDLAGHRLIGAQDGGVHCEGSCTITGGGGAITTSAAAEAAWTGDSFGITSGQWLDGIHFPLNATVTVLDTTISGYHAAARTPRMVLANCVVTGNDSGVSAKVLRISGSYFSNETVAAAGRRLTITNSSFIGNGNAVSGHKIEISDSEITGCRGIGVAGGKIVAVESSIDGNCIGPLSGEFCADLVASRRKRPRLTNTTCSTSLEIVSWKPWGVCALD